jgi:hypothetical protein
MNSFKKFLEKSNKNDGSKIKLLDKAKGFFKKSDTPIQSPIKPNESSSTFSLPQDNVTGNKITDKNNINKGEGLQAVFKVIYTLLVIIGAALIVIHWITIIIDVIKYSYRNTVQESKLVNNPNLLNKDTNEYRLLHYTKNIKDDEPYSIFLRQKFVNYMYVIVSIFFIILAFQIAFILSVWLFALINNSGKPDIKIILPTKNIFVIIMILLAGIAFSGIYKSKFLKQIQKSFIETKESIEEINNFIYDNMTTNQELLDALQSEDKLKIYDILNKQITEYSLSKMVFTLSLYEYMLSNIKKNSDEYQEIKKIFTIDQIKIRSIYPTDFFYYKQNVYIPNMYITLKDDLKPKALLINNAIDLQKENSFNILLNNRITNINNKLLKILKLPKIKGELFVYLLTLLTLSLIIIIILAFLYIDPIIEFIKKIIDFLKRLKNKD